MKVYELIAELQQLDPNLIVIKQRDDEGNGYQKGNGVEVAFVPALELSQYHIDSVYTEADANDEGVMEECTPVAVLW